MITAQQAFPKGNALVGDKAWLKVKGKPVLTDLVVVQTGMPGKGRGLFVKLAQTIKGKTRFKSMNVHTPGLFIIPKTLPQSVKSVVRENSGILVVRNGGNNQDERFEFLCRSCLNSLYILSTQIVTMDFGWRADSGFTTGKENIDGSDKEIKCIPACRQTHMDLTEILDDLLDDDYDGDD